MPLKTVASSTLVLSITNGVTDVKDPLTPLASNSLIPYKLASVSNQYVPATGVPVGALVVGVNSAKSTSARAMYALELTPNALYAACRPYSFSSPPCIGLLLESV